MAPVDHSAFAEPGAGSGAGSATGDGSAGADSHWVRWHGAYEDPSSGLSARLRAVQSMLGAALDEVPAGTEEIRVVSLCAGQGRDVIDVVATHRRGPAVSALLVEQDPALVRFARNRAEEAGVGDRVRIVEGDASQSRLYAGAVPADVVLVCGVFGNISAADITRTIQAMPGWCTPHGQVIWTRHRRPPDQTPAIRADFAAAGFTELAFVSSEGTIQTVGRHRLDRPDGVGSVVLFDPDQHLFDFVGDGVNPL
jgi:predicted RNA methylase